jgi:signal transduction histidine kinase
VGSDGFRSRISRGRGAAQREGAHELADALADRTRELERSRARFRDVIERNADAIVVVDREGRIRFANQVATELFSSSREELVGTPFGFPLVAGDTTDLDIVHGGVARVVEMRVVDSEWEGEDAYLASLRDITERKRAEAAARRLIREQAARSVAEAAARRFRLLAHSSAVLAASLDYEVTLVTLARLCTEETADWAVVYATDAHGNVRRLDVAHRDPSRAAAAEALQDLPIPADSPHPVLDVLRTHKPLLVREVDEARLRQIASGTEHLSLLRELGVSSFLMVPLIARERCLGVIALVSADPARRYGEQDLELAKDLALRAALAVDNARLYEQAREANRAKTDLLAVISHDLRTPLNSIMGYAELLSMGLPEPLSPAAHERVERVRGGARHLLYLIDELLSFARLDAGRVELRIQDVDAQQLARDVAGVVEPLAQKRGLQFRLEPPPGPATLRSDPDKLRQVLLNLTGNAIKYTPEGEVRLRVRARDGQVQLEVEDTGVGIPAEQLPHIFEPFWQATTTQRNEESGTGLGLSVVERLVRLLSGEIEVRSTPGAGSTFTVTLPEDGVGTRGVEAECAPTAESMPGRGRLDGGL